MKYHATLKTALSLQKDQINAERLSAQFLQKLSAEILQKDLSGHPLFEPHMNLELRQNSQNLVVLTKLNFWPIGLENGLEGQF